MFSGSLAQRAACEFSVIPPKPKRPARQRTRSRSVVCPCIGRRAYAHNSSAAEQMLAIGRAEPSCLVVVVVVVSTVSSLRPSIVGSMSIIGATAVAQGCSEDRLTECSLGCAARAAGRRAAADRTDAMWRDAETPGRVDARRGARTQSETSNRPTGSLDSCTNKQMSHLHARTHNRNGLPQTQAQAGQRAGSALPIAKAPLCASVHAR